jgi:hypothetical protein
LVFSDLTWEVCSVCWYLWLWATISAKFVNKKKKKKKEIIYLFFFFFFFWKSWFYMKYIGENRRWRTIMSTYSILRKHWWYQMDNKKPWAAEVNGQNYNGKKINNDLHRKHIRGHLWHRYSVTVNFWGNIVRTHKLWNILLTEIYILHMQVLQECWYL